MGALDDLLAPKGAAEAAPAGGGALDRLLAGPKPAPPWTGFARPGETVGSDFGGLYSDVREAARSNIAGMHEGLEHVMGAGSIGGKALGALELLGSAAAYPLSPIQGFIAHGPGRIVEQFTGYPHQTVGELGSFAVQLATDPVLGATKLARAFRASGVGKAVETTLSPTTMTRGSQLTGLIMRRFSGQQAAAFARASNDLEQFRGVINRLPEADRFEFMHRIERGVPQRQPALQPIADKLRAMLKEWEGKVQSLGKGHLENALENYFPHIWKDPNKAQTVMESLHEEYARAASKRPLRGSANFLRARTVETIMAGRQRGLQLVTTDPLELTLIKLREVQKFYYGTVMANAIKESRLARFVPIGKRPPIGWKGLDDKVFRATLPPAEVIHEALHETAYDPAVRRGLQRVADFLGFKIRTPLRGQDPAGIGRGALGYTGAVPGADVVSRFGNELQVMEHEVGHQIDITFNLWERFSKNPQAWRELGNLALGRIGLLSPAHVAEAARYLGQAYPYMEPGKSFVGYVLSGMERMANFFHAYWYAPQLVRELAPHMLGEFEEWLNTVAAKQVGADGRSLKQVIQSVKPSVGIAGEAQREVFTTKVPGIRHMGAWYAPEDVARVFNNYVSPGLYGKNALFDLVRHGENALNSLQLGMSFFHATFTSIDTMSSRLSLAIEQAARGEFGKAALNALKAPLPTTAIETVMKGHRLRNAFLNPRNQTSDMRKMVEALETAGGRVNMDQFYRVVEGKGLVRSLRDGSFVRSVSDAFKENPAAAVLKAPFNIASRALQDVAYPVLEFMVPRQKLGVFYDMAKDWIDANPKATPLELSHAMQLAWDSVDNRLGQMVYDNIFWNKAQKDVAFIATRSVGWNLGTIRELGGGFMDLGAAMSALATGEKIEMTRRMAYTIAMPTVTALYGGVATYLLTGEAPTQIIDYFFPPTGGTTPHGMPERVSIPSYVKDVLEYNRAPLQTLENKVNPIWGVLNEITSNRDFYGGVIVNPDDPAFEQLRQFGEYMGEVVTPFSFRSYQRERTEGGSWGDLLASFLGFQAAPGFVTDPDRLRAFQERETRAAIRRRGRE